MELTTYIIVALVGGLIGYLLAYSGERAKLAASEAELKLANASLQELRAILVGAQQNLSAEQGRSVELKLEIQKLTTTLENERESAQAQLASWADGEERIKSAFGSLATAALKGNTADFLTLAQEKLTQHTQSAAADLTLRKKEVGDLVTPLAKTLKDLQEQVQELEKARVGAYSGINVQIEGLLGTQKELKVETSRLVSALRAPAQRGRWGEIQLKRILELAGMVDHCDFYEQKSFDSDDVRLRPDFIVHLPGNRQLVVDSKVALVAYMDAAASEDEGVRASKLKEHAGHVRAHLDRLASKAYWNQLGCTPDFVVAFMHDEGCLSAALQYDPSLIEVGAEQKVILATPTTLIALLKAVEYGWRQEKLAQNAEAISKLGKSLYERLANLFDQFAALKKSIEGSVSSFNSLIGSVETRVMVPARKLRELGASGDEPIGKLESIDRIPREITDNRIPSQPPLPITLERIVAVTQMGPDSEDEEEN